MTEGHSDACPYNYPINYPITSPTKTPAKQFFTQRKKRKIMAIYKITNVASNKCLNVHGNNVTTISPGQNVTIWSDSGTNEQRWDVSTLSNNALIRTVINYRYTPHVASGFIAFRQESQGSWYPGNGAPTDMRSMGNCIAINHNNPDMTIEPELYTRSIYMHLRDKPAFETGTFIEKGQLIGYIGNTGTSSAPHLHFALATGSTANMKPGNTGWIGTDSLPHINPTRYLPSYTA